MITHTPEPWAVSSFTHRGEEAYVIKGAYRDLSSELGYEETMAETRDRDDANRRLIEAAPELLTALEAAVPNLQWANIHGSRCEELLQQVRAALVKARGEEP